MDIPPGRFAVLADPAGAMFNVIKMAQPGRLEPVSAMSSNARSTRCGGRSRFVFGTGVLPAHLTRAAHHEQIARRRARGCATCRRLSGAAGTGAARRASRSRYACRSSSRSSRSACQATLSCAVAVVVARRAGSGTPSSASSGSPIVSSAGWGSGSPRRYQRERRGSSSTRSYMRRRPCFQSTLSTSTSSSVSAPSSQPRATSIHDASSSSMRSNRGVGRRAAHRRRAASAAACSRPATVANRCSCSKAGISRVRAGRACSGRRACRASGSPARHRATVLTMRSSAPCVCSQRGRAERPCRRASPSCAAARCAGGPSGSRAARAAATRASRRRTAACAARRLRVASFGPGPRVGDRDAVPLELVGHQVVVARSRRTGRSLEICT